MPVSEVLHRAEMLRRAGSLAQAEEIYRTHLSNASRDTAVRNKLAELLLERGNSDSSISEYVKIQKILVQQGNILGAISAGVKVIKIDPDFENPLSYVAKIQTEDLQEEQRRKAATVEIKPIRPLSEIPLLADLNPAEIGVVAASMHSHSVERGDFVFREGEAGASLFFVSSGLLEASSGGRKLGQS